MVKTWFGFYLIYLLVASVPSVILLVRRFGWSWRFFAISVLISWTGGGWFIMTYMAVLKKRSGMAL
jgi:hypothetical protein